MAASFQAPRDWVATTGVEVERPGTAAPLVDRTSADGASLAVAAGFDGLLSVVIHDPVAGARFAQIGDSSSGLRLEPVRWLDLGAQHGLLVMDEVDVLDVRRRLLVAIDRTDGSLSWAQAMSAVRARALDDGSTLAQVRDVLVLLDSRGVPRWARTLREFVGPGESLNFPALDIESDRIVVAFRRTRDSVPFAARLVMLDADSGAQLWQADAEWPASAGLCATEIGDDAVRTVWTQSAGVPDSYLVHLERRSPTDGSLMSSTNWPAAYVPDECQVFDAGDRTLALAREDSGPADLTALPGNGALLWQRSWTTTGPRAFTPVPASGDVLVVTPNADATGARVERVRSADGTPAWTVELADRHAASVTLAVAGGEALATEPRGSALDVVRLDLATGAVLGQESHATRRRQLLPATGIFIDTTPFDLAAGFGADGSLLRLRRLDPATQGVAQWTVDLQGLEPALEATAVGIQSAGPAALVVRAEYATTGADPEQRVVLHAVDRASGAVLWRRVIERLRPASFLALEATADGALITGSNCDASCTTGTSALLRLSMVDGSTRWSVPMTPRAARFVAGDVLVLRSDPGPTARWQRLAGIDGTPVWTQSLAAGLTLWEIDTASPSTFEAAYAATIAGTPVVDIEQRGLDGGASNWTVRLGLSGDQVSIPALRRTADGTLLASARLRGPEPGQVGLARPLLQRLDAQGQTLSLLRPLITGDQFWDLRLLAAEPGSATTPLRSLRFLVSQTRSSNQRVSLAGVDAANGLTGEHLIERHFDDPIAGLSGLGLVRVTADGSVLATEQRVFASGLRQPSLVRLAPPGPARGDLQLRVIDAEGFGLGMGPTRRLVAEVDNVGMSDASGASAGIAVQRGIDRAFAVAVGCEIVSGTGTCLTVRGPGGELRFDIGAGSTVRLEWDVLDANFTTGLAPGQAIRTGGRVFVDSPYAFGDVELGNQVASFVLRTGAFVDDFE